MVEPPLWKIMEFVSWDDDSPNWMESHNPFMFQTTNQVIIVILIINITIVICFSCWNSKPPFMFQTTIHVPNHQPCYNQHYIHDYHHTWNSHEHRKITPRGFTHQASNEWNFATLELRRTRGQTSAVFKIWTIQFGGLILNEWFIEWFISQCW